MNNKKKEIKIPVPGGRTEGLSEIMEKKKEEKEEKEKFSPVDYRQLEIEEALDRKNKNVKEIIAYIIDIAGRNIPKYFFGRRDKFSYNHPAIRKEIMEHLGNDKIFIYFRAKDVNSQKGQGDGGRVVGLLTVEIKRKDVKKKSGMRQVVVEPEINFEMDKGYAIPEKVLKDIMEKSAELSSAAEENVNTMLSESLMSRMSAPEQHTRPLQNFLDDEWNSEIQLRDDLPIKNKEDLIGYVWTVSFRGEKLEEFQEWCEKNDKILKKYFEEEQ